MTEVTNQAEIKLTRVFSRTPSSWDPQDDLLLRHLKEQQKLGWKEIASHFAHRTPNACQFRWRRLRSGSLKSSNSTTGAAASAATTTTTNTTPGDTNSHTRTSSTTTPSPSFNSSTPAANTTASSTPSQLSTSIHKNSSTPPSPSALEHEGVSHGVYLKKFPTVLPPQIKSSTISSNSIHHNNQFTFKSSSTRKIQDNLHDPLSSNYSYSPSSSIDDDNGDENVKNSEWTSEEDELLLDRRKRQLSFVELSILLPSRSENEISFRINELDKRSRSTSAIMESPNKTTPIKVIPRQSSLQPTTSSHSHPIHSIVKKNKRSQSSSSSSLSHLTSLLNVNNTHIHHNHQQQQQQQHYNHTSSNNQNQLMSQDSLRSKSFSFSYIPPVHFPIERRYSSVRKNSSSSINSKKTSRSNSIMKYSFNSSLVNYSSEEDNVVVDDDDDDDDDELHPTHYKTSNIRVGPIRSSLPPLGTLFNDYYAK